MVENEVVQTAPQPQEADMVTRAEEVVKRLDAKFAETKALLEKNQATEARIILGGQSVAGQAPPVKEETPKEYTERILRGGK